MMTMLFLVFALFASQCQGLKTGLFNVNTMRADEIKPKINKVVPSVNDPVLCGGFCLKEDDLCDLFHVNTLKSDCYLGKNDLTNGDIFDPDDHSESLTLYSLCKSI